MPDVIDLVVGVVASAMEDVMRQGEDIMRETVDVPSPPPSQWGQPPHSRSGLLRDSCGHSSERNGDIVTGQVFNDAPYAETLVNDLGRDFVTPVRDAIVGGIPSIMAARIEAADIH